MPDVVYSRLATLYSLLSALVSTLYDRHTLYSPNFLYSLATLSTLSTRSTLPLYSLLTTVDPKLPYLQLKKSFEIGLLTNSPKRNCFGGGMCAYLPTVAYARLPEPWAGFLRSDSTHVVHYMFHVTSSPKEQISSKIHMYFCTLGEVT